MSARLHITPIYQIEYGDTVSNELTDKIINLIKDSETGWIDESESEMEIDFIELDKIMINCKDPELKDALKNVIDESDRRNDFIHLSLF